MLGKLQTYKLQPTKFHEKRSLEGFATGAPATLAFYTEVTRKNDEYKAQTPAYHKPIFTHRYLLLHTHIFAHTRAYLQKRAQP